MENKYLDNNGNELIVASVNGFLRLYTSPTRSPYSGPVTIHSSCENGNDPCNSQSGNGCGCECKGIAPNFSMRPQTDIQGYKENTEYDHQVIKDALNFGDTLPNGTCSSEKLFIFCRDAIIACEWHLEDGWIIDAIIEVDFAQAY